jgi:hypothetical protein
MGTARRVRSMFASLPFVKTAILGFLTLFSGSIGIANEVSRPDSESTFPSLLTVEQAVKLAFRKSPLVTIGKATIHGAYSDYRSASVPTPLYLGFSHVAGNESPSFNHWQQPR